MQNMDRSVYKAAICPQQNVESSQLQENLSRRTVGGGNTVLHLASAEGNLSFIKKTLSLDLPRGFLEAHNNNGNIALHEAAERGHYEVVVELLHQGRSLVTELNNLNQTPLFKACEGGHPRVVEMLLKADPSKLLDKSSDGRTCLHVVVNRGDAGLLNYLLRYIKDPQGPLGHEMGKNMLKEIDSQGNTVLHLAARRDRVDMVTRLLDCEPDLSFSLNLEKETAICVAVKLRFLPVVEELVKFCPESIEIASKNGKNILHLAVELSQVKILKFLCENVKLSQLINQPDEAPPKDNTQGQGGPNDTPLHIAARNKNVCLVELLMKIPGVDKDAVNSAGLTPLDIARENTEYHESYKIIEKLSSFPLRLRTFLYSAPTMSVLKQNKAHEMLEKIFADRRNVELVVAVLLATMTFTAVFTVPGGFNTEPPNKNSSMLDVLQGSNSEPPKKDSSPLVMPMLIGYESFKLFLVFDCLAFFLSLFVVLMWEMSTPLTARDKMLFMYVTNAVLCAAFAFTAVGLMAAVYAVLAHKVKKFAGIVLGSSMLIVFCGSGAFFYLSAKFTVRRARFHSLCGVPRRLDDIVDKWWVWAEKRWILDAVRRFDDFGHRLVSGDKKGNMMGVGECSSVDNNSFDIFVDER